MSESEIDQRLDAIIAEIRKQGRAGIAAQAAAEACLDELKSLRADLDRDSEPPDSSEQPAEVEEAERVILALLPVADAIDRVLAEGDRLAATPEPPMLARLFGARSVGVDAASLREAVRVLQASLDQTLASFGVRPDRRVGIPVDGDVHRVVEACDAPPGSPPDTVLRVVRAGYERNGRLLREADVVATRQSERR